MLCCLCQQKEAKVHLTKIVNDKVQKVDLCEDCAREKGVDDPTGFNLADLLLGLGAASELEQATGDPETKCPNCGFSQADFKKSGRLGCAQCYEVFAEGLEPMLKSMHKGIRHVGKTPESFAAGEDASERIQELSKKLEQAAALRDQIKALKNAPGGAGARK